MVETFSRFFDRRRTAASGYVAGDGSAIDAMVPHSGEATFHSPTGGTITGGIAQ
jgi:hypothetical protein